MTDLFLQDRVQTEPEATKDVTMKLYQTTTYKPRLIKKGSFKKTQDEGVEHSILYSKTSGVLSIQPMGSKRRYQRRGSKCPSMMIEALVRRQMEPEQERQPLDEVSANQETWDIDMSE